MSLKRISVVFVLEWEAAFLLCASHSSTSGQVLGLHLFPALPDLWAAIKRHTGYFDHSAEQGKDCMRARFYFAWKLVCFTNWFVFIYVYFQSSPVLDVCAVLRSSVHRRRTILTVPWIVEFLSMLDYVGPFLPFYRTALCLLLQIYKWVYDI